MSTHRTARRAADHSARAINRHLAERFADTFRCLADPTRVLILHELASAGHPMMVGELVEQIGMAQSTISHHLRLLRDGGFVTVEQRGTASLFSISPDCMQCLPAAMALIVGGLREADRVADPDHARICGTAGSVCPPIR